MRDYNDCSQHRYAPCVGCIELSCLGCSYQWEHDVAWSEVSKYFVRHSAQRIAVPYNKDLKNNQ